jgi:hypothetical protein
MINNEFYQKNMLLINSLLGSLVGLVYLSSILHTYTPYRFDDTWFTSFIYNDYTYNIRTDEVFGGDLNNGLGGTQLFGKIYATIYGSIAFFFSNWSKQFLYVITEGFMLLSVLVWGVIAKHYQLSTRHILILCLSMLFSQSFFTFSHSVRPEVFVLFFSSLSLLCFLKFQYGLSILFAFIAIETHPVGSVAVFMILILLNNPQQVKFIRDNALKLSIYLISIGISCILLYLMLHGEFIEKASQVKQAYRPLFSENFFITYYTFPKYYHTLPEALLVGFAVIMYIRKKFYKSELREIGFLFLALIVFSVIINRGMGGAYAVLAYPLFFLLIFSVFIKMDKLGLLLILLLAFYIPKYAYIYYRNLHYPSYDTAYQELLKRNLPEDNLPIVGLPNDYWAFMHNRRFYMLCYIDLSKFNREVSEAWLIKHSPNEFFNFYQNLPCPNQGNIEKNYSKQFTKKIDDRNIELYKITRI